MSTKTEKQGAVIARAVRQLRVDLWLKGKSRASDHVRLDDLHREGYTVVPTMALGAAVVALLTWQRPEALTDREKALAEDITRTLNCAWLEADRVRER